MYDFDIITDRRRADAVKWAVGENELPMWVADMDFKAAPEIINAITERAQHGIFGYTDLCDDWYDAYIGWWSRRHGYTMQKDRLIFCTGVVPAISSIIRKLTTPNENIVVLSPGYGMFFNCAVNSGRVVSESVLKYSNGEYEIDYDDLESRLADPQTAMMIVCNPHNPIGRIWTRDELLRIGMLCKKHGVLVLSDEIHCDITSPGKEYIPFASLSDELRDISITCIAPTKAFNLAGIQTAAVSVPEPFLYHKVWRGLNTDDVAEPNAFATVAAIAAFTHGEKWLDELREYIYANKCHAVDYIKRNIPQIKVNNSDATYLLWLDCRDIYSGEPEISEVIRAKTGLFLSGGSHYGKGGDGFARMNVACPRTLLDDGLARLKAAVDAIQNNMV